MYFIQDTGGSKTKTNLSKLFFLAKQISKLIKIKNQVLICTQRAILEVVEKKHANKTIQSGITSMNDDELESLNVTRMCNSEAYEHEETSSNFDNENKENTPSTSDKEDEEATNVHNGTLKMYERGKCIFQSTQKCACTASDQTFEYIRDRIAQCKSLPENFRFIHKHIRNFHDVRKYHLDLKDLSFDGVNIIDEDVSAHT